MIFGRLFVAALSLFVGAALYSQPTSLERHGTNTARDGQFVVIEMFADDSRKFYQEWLLATPPNWRTINTTVRNRPFSLMFVFGGCVGDEFGICDVAADVMITGPAGRKIADYKDVPVFAQSTSNELILAPASLKITIEKDEPLGRYRVDLALTDRVAQKTVRVFDYVTVSEAVAR